MSINIHDDHLNSALYALSNLIIYISASARSLYLSLQQPLSLALSLSLFAAYQFSGSLIV